MAAGPPPICEAHAEMHDNTAEIRPTNSFKERGVKDKTDKLMRFTPSHLHVRLPNGAQNEKTSRKL